MDAKNSYKFGLFGRCPVCKEIFKISCKKCSAENSFVDSGRSNHVLCQQCGTHNQLTCPKAACHQAPLQYRTPKNEDEKKRIDLYIEIKKDKERDQRNFEIKEKHTRSVVQIVEIAQDGSYSVPSMQQNRAKINTGSEPAPQVEERRIVNQFYDETDNGEIDKKTVFEVVYDEQVYFNCTICGRVDIPVKCTRCNATDKFNLNYEALSCQCGNQMKIAVCSCGAKQSHQDFFLKSDNVKWQFSRAKSYYDYCKGRMTVFSTCPVCNIFSAEQCATCGSKVNFGLPNDKNEVFCKSCGTVNTFKCENRKCTNAIKKLQNPESTEQKFEWLQKVMNLKKAALRQIATSRVLDSDLLPTDFIDKIQKKNQEMMTDSFVNEVKREVKAQTVVQQTVYKHNRRRLIGPGFYIIVGTLLIIIAVLSYEVQQFRNDKNLQKAFKQILPDK